MDDAALFVQSVLLPLLNTISSKDLKYIYFSIRGHSGWETDALLNALNPEVCIQIDELLAEGHFAELQDVSIDYDLFSIVLDDSQRVSFSTEILAGFPKLNNKNMLNITYVGGRFPSDAERAFKTKQLVHEQPRPTEQAAA
ncbi:uncharacterized protein LAESUDRAFT_154292 [Laetiporus sulphureus 93-53]|uniref:Uncharacterized protein n=1 Tax=Laetiporus sulphureus 93-53 TaxID=1314785 RepID=A0A165HK69_9APHY|nr:uncharacterized protein LAESUDRAFT_154292 [Laetiporus sulphureus 93-53]KZT11836.1 hypothetical protein LAESUDRAFT_154292 [Laetiporus sulphureus 93-53]